MEIANDDATGSTIDGDEIEHFGFREHLHRATRDLMAQARLGCKDRRHGGFGREPADGTAQGRLLGFARRTHGELVDAPQVRELAVTEAEPLGTAPRPTIHATEAEVGAQLFRRHRRGALPTPACEAFLPAAQQALAALQRGREALQREPALPRLTLASLPSLSSVIFGPVLLALADAALEIRCSTDHSPAIMERLLTGQAQVGFVLRCPPMAGIQMERIWRSPMVAVVHNRHPLASAGSLQLADIANERLAPQYWGEGCDELLALCGDSPPRASHFLYRQKVTQKTTLVSRRKPAKNQKFEAPPKLDGC